MSSEAWPALASSVSDVSFTVRGGEIVGLIGPNGAGKSTTFNLLTGVARPSSGAVRFRGQRIDRLPPRAIPLVEQNARAEFADDRRVIESCLGLARQ